MKIPYEIIRKKRDGEVLNKDEIFSSLFHYNNSVTIPKVERHL